MPEPAARWSSARSALTTIPSMPNGSEARSAAISPTRARTSSTVLAVMPGTAVAAVVCTPYAPVRIMRSLCAPSSSSAVSSGSVSSTGSRP